MNIRDAITQLTLIQSSLAITSPIIERVRRAYMYHPPRNSLAPNTPCFMNSWTLTREERDVALRIQYYTINMQFMVLNADQDVAADIATAFFVELVDALDVHVQLNGSVTQQDLRGGNPTLVFFDFAGKAFIGFNAFLDLELKESKAFA